MTIEYLGRELEVEYEYSKPEIETGFAGETEIISVKYKGRDITRLVDEYEIILAVENEKLLFC